jgi:putative transposase
LGDTRYLDEVFIKINGVLHYLWRAVGEDDDEIDILVQKRKDKHAGKKELMPCVEHSTQHYENNRCELRLKFGIGS